MKPQALSLYLVTDRGLSLGRDIHWIVEQAVAGGVTMVQLREKDIDTREFIDLARSLKKLLAPLGVPLVINDRVDVALAADVDGVHIGQSDMSYEDARRLLGPDKIIGLSVENMEQVLQANELDVDYIGVSPVFSTATKTDTAAPFGLEGLAKAVELSVHPTVAIGGMNTRTAAQVFATGTDGIAVVSAIVSAEDPRQAAAELVQFSKWTSRIWERTRALYESILEQPFIKELAAGTLDSSKFARYIAQDEVYLSNYGRQMIELAQMMDNAQERDFFMGFAQGGMEGEAAMHQLLIDRFGIDTAVESSYVTTWYNTNSQHAVDTGCKEIALASLLPCAWIYNEVGKYILRTANLEGNPYKEWIMEYGNEEFSKGVTALLEMVDRWAAATDEKTREAMNEAYIISARGEYAFWDYGYQGEEGDYSYLEK